MGEVLLKFIPTLLLLSLQKEGTIQEQHIKEQNKTITNTEINTTKDFIHPKKTTVIEILK